MRSRQHLDMEKRYAILHGKAECVGDVFVDVVGNVREVVWVRDGEILTVIRVWASV